MMNYLYPNQRKRNNKIRSCGEVKMDFNKMIPELSVFDINKKKNSIAD